MTAEKISKAFEDPNCNTVTLTADETVELSPIAKLDIPENKTLVVETELHVDENDGSDPTSGKITIASGGKLVIGVNGSLSNYDELINAGTLTNNGTLDNYGTFTNNGTFTNSGIFTNVVTLDNTGTINNSGSITNEGTITDTGKGIILESSSTLTNKNSIEGSVTLETGSMLTNNKEITGNITLSGTSKLINSATGTITGGIILGDGSTLTNSGAMTATSSWSVKKAIINNTETIDMGANAISVSGSLDLSSVGTITGNGAAVISLTGDGTLTLGSDSSSGGSISNTNDDTANKHYAIAVGAASTIEWNDVNVTISTGTTDIGNTIQNLIYDSTNKTVTGGVDILTYDTDNYNLIWDENSKMLSLKTPE